MKATTITCDVCGFEDQCPQSWSDPAGWRQFKLMENSLMHMQFEMCPKHKPVELKGKIMEFLTRGKTGTK